MVSNFRVDALPQAWVESDVILSGPYEKPISQLHPTTLLNHTSDERYNKIKKENSVKRVLMRAGLVEKRRVRSRQRSGRLHSGRRRPEGPQDNGAHERPHADIAREIEAAPGRRPGQPGSLASYF